MSLIPYSSRIAHLVSQIPSADEIKSSHGDSASAKKMQQKLIDAHQDMVAHIVEDVANFVDLLMEKKRVYINVGKYMKQRYPRLLEAEDDAAIKGSTLTFGFAKHLPRGRRGLMPMQAAALDNSPVDDAAAILAKKGYCLELVDKCEKSFNSSGRYTMVPVGGNQKILILTFCK